MNKRWLWIFLGVIVLGMVLLAGAAAGAGFTYFALRAVPVEAAQANLLETISFDNKDDELGVLVIRVEDGSPAALSGIQRGDIILAVDDRQVNNMRDLMRVIQGKSAGDEITLSVQRCDTTEEVSVELAEKNDHIFLGLHMSREPIFDVLPFRRRALSLAVEQPAFVITQVIPDSPAHDAGLNAGMLIVGVDGEDINEGDDLSEIIQTFQPGDEITLVLSLPGQDSTRQVDVILGAHPDDTDRAYLGIGYFSVPGNEGENLPGKRQPHFNMPNFQNEMPLPPGMFPEFMPEWHNHPSFPGGFEQAVVISSVSEDSPAEQAGIESGDLITAVNGESFQTAAKFIEVVQGFDPGDEITLTIFRAGESEEITIEVKLGEHPLEDGLAYLGVKIGEFIHLNGDEPFHKFDMPFHFEFGFPWPEGDFPGQHGDPLRGDEA